MPRLMKYDEEALQTALIAVQSPASDSLAALYEARTAIKVPTDVSSSTNHTTKAYSAPITIMNAALVPALPGLAGNADLWTVEALVNAIWTGFAHHSFQPLTIREDSLSARK
ncbi:MAG: hypothetical protein Q9200_002963 [Gallowayella weberi]